MKSERDVLTDLQAALDVAPSAEFAAGVRARVAEDTARRAWWPWASLAAAAVVIVAVVVVMRTGEPVVSSTRVAVAERPAAAPAPAVNVPVEVPLVRVRATKPAPMSMTVLVSPDQARLVRLAFLRASGQEVGEAKDEGTDAAAPLPAPAPIDIEPIKIQPVMKGERSQQ